MGAKLHIRVLGRFEWSYENGPNSLRELPRPATAKSQSLLAFLVSQRTEQHARARLMTMFWGERPERKARRSLSTALWHIRHECCSNALRTELGAEPMMETAAWHRAIAGLAPFNRIFMHCIP